MKLALATLAILAGLAAPVLLAASAEAGTCRTTCTRYGNSSNCTTNCY